MSGVDFVVKLGGSAVTDKHTLETLNKQCIQWASQILADRYRHGQRFVIIHGAGSFGHHHARQYEVNKGFDHKDDPESRESHFTRIGFCKTRISVCKLNQYIVEALVEEGIPAVSLSPSSAWKTQKAEVTRDGTEMVRDLLRQGFIPCLHGDCVLDELQGCKILSGDTIIRVLCRVLKPKRVVFLTNVQGIYTAPPDTPDSKLLHKITVKSNGELDLEVETRTEEKHDVTGGIQYKLQTATEIIQEHRGSIPVYVCGISDSDFNTACSLSLQSDGAFGGTIIEGGGE